MWAREDWCIFAADFGVNAIFKELRNQEIQTCMGQKINTYREREVLAVPRSIAQKDLQLFNSLITVETTSYYIPVTAKKGDKLKFKKDDSDSEYDEYEIFEVESLQGYSKVFLMKTG